MWFAVKLAARLVIITTLAAVGATGCASLDGWQRKAIFQHTSSERFAHIAAPDAAETYDLPLANGDKVHAWYLRAGADDAPTMLFLHGARRNLNGSASRITHLQSLGFNVLAIDYRGFGRSTPILPSEASATEDTRRAFEELKRREPDPAKRFVYGYSLGGALAIALAAREDGIAGVVIESTFTSIPDLVRETKWGWLPFVRLLVTQDFDSLGRIARVNEPLLVLHGTADGVVPHAMADRLYAAAVGVPAEYKRVVKIEGANHRGVIGIGGERYDRAVREFAAQASRAAAASLSASTAVVH
jgi:pimeloyl-ACP methyl ester carboxylesterase